MNEVDQKTTTQMTHTTPSHNIKIDVETTYVETHSNPVESRYVFAYTITIYNEGDIAAQLLKRRWLITDANGKVQEVRGDGVVGKQPYLRPGEGFQYSSATMIETPIGSMQGHYQMIAENGQSFLVEIAPFSLVFPNTVLH
jgi:ApaG protein